MSDADDRLVFTSHNGPDLVETILRIKHGDPAAKELTVESATEMEGVAWRRLGEIVGQSRHLEKLVLKAGQLSLHAADFCAGLRTNRSIKSFEVRLLLQHIPLSPFVPFLVNNPNLRVLRLPDNLGPNDANLLLGALLDRSEDTLDCLGLWGNPFGDIDLDPLAEMVGIRFLYLEATGIGRRGCASLAKLLGNPQSNLRVLCLRGNAIDDIGVSTLIDSLAKHTRLFSLNLDNNEGITAVGWSKVSNLLCNSSSISQVLKSNHTLHDLGFYTDECRRTIDNALGIDGANFLCAALKSNKDPWKWITMRQKILWSHARGDLNIGSSNIANGALPYILAWIGGATDGFMIESDCIQYHKPPLPLERIRAVRLDAFYRVLRSRPNLCSRANASR